MRAADAVEQFHVLRVGGQHLGEGRVARGQRRHAAVHLHVDRPAQQASRAAASAGSASRRSSSSSVLLQPAHRGGRQFLLRGEIAVQPPCARWPRAAPRPRSASPRSPRRAAGSSRRRWHRGAGAAPGRWNEGGGARGGAWSVCVTCMRVYVTRVHRCDAGHPGLDARVLSAAAARASSTARRGCPASRLPSRPG